MSRDQDHNRPATLLVSGPAPGTHEPALTPQHDVHQHNLRPQLSCSLYCLSRGSGTADHTQALPFQQSARSLKKPPVVIHNQDTERHTDSVPARSIPRIAASSHPKICVLAAPLMQGKHIHCPGCRC